MSEATRLLLVEDEDGMVVMMTAYLERRGYNVTVARDGLEAQKALSSSPPFDLVLSDIRMPRADGMAVLKSAMSGANPPSVILMTAFASVEGVIEAMRHGAYGYVKKPIMDLDGELGLMINRAMAERKLKRENEQLMEKLKHVTVKLATRQKEIDAEIEMAAHIQRSLLPDEHIQGHSLFVETRRMIGEGVSGDFYDIIPLEDGRTAIAMGTVLGRDLPAAILMASITGHLRELTKSETDPERILVRTNEGILPILEKGYRNFISAFHGIIDPKNG
ncbi:MAG: PP2C family protein-serine/threonine phosphatase, partial [Planctomycetota bacterium]